MTTLQKAPVLKMLILAMLMHIGLVSRAQLSAAGPFRQDSPDSSTKSTTEFLLNRSTDAAIPVVKASHTRFRLLEETDRELQKSIAYTISKSEERKLLMQYLKQLEVDEKLSANQANRKLFYRFANLFARLKLYPLAMKCYFKTIAPDKKRKILNDKPSITAFDSTGAVNTSIQQLSEVTKGYEDLPINDKDDSLLNNQAMLVKNEKSQRTTYSRIAGTFNDGKTAVAYAMLFHVKQPIPGKKKIFVFANTGHTFITLIKYNSDSTYVSCSFGFYPKKDQILAATPAFPSSPAQLKNDNGHQWDEVVGKFISKKKFERILTLTKKYNDLEYHLSKNNCTDFCLQAATLAGINIEDTKGKWPLGSGNNPGTTGQSLLNGKFSNSDPNAVGSLFSTVNLSVLP